MTKGTYKFLRALQGTPIYFEKAIINLGYSFLNGCSVTWLSLLVDVALTRFQQSVNSILFYPSLINKSPSNQSFVNRATINKSGSVESDTVGSTTDFNLILPFNVIICKMLFYCTNVL